MRIATLAALGEEISDACREGSTRPTPHEGLRDRLRTQMTARAAIWNESRWFRVRRAVDTLPLTLRVALSAVVLLLIAQTTWRSYVTIAAPTTAPEIDAAALPIRVLTPGAVGPVNLDAMCARRTVEKPPVAPAVRDAVLHGYRMEQVAAHEYELDYLVTPELGGVAEARNLWPERYSTNIWNARVKDALEDLLPQLICRGQLDLATAQRDIAENWIAAYKKYFKTDRPIRTPDDLRDDDDNRPRASAHVRIGTFGTVFVARRVEVVASRERVVAGPFAFTGSRSVAWR